MAEAVVGLALLVIRKHFVGAVYLFELFSRIARRVSVRVVVHRQFAIGTLQLLRIGGAPNAKHVVEITL